MGQLMFGEPKLAQDVSSVSETEAFWKIVGEDNMKPIKSA